MKKLSLLLLFFSFTAFAQSEEKINEILSQLSLDEKIDLIHAQSKFSVPGVDRLGIPELWMSDGPHGVRGEINWDNWGYAGWTNDYITAFPALTALGASFNPSLSEKYGRALGEEARYRKKDILLGPGVNIYRTPLNGRNFEYLGEDPYLASIMSVPYIHGLQSNGVAACVKHYVLNNQELYRDRIDVVISDRALYEIYLPAFKTAVQQADVWSIMGAYNRYEEQFCSHNEKLNKILKEDWGFDGVMITDWGAAHDTEQSALYGLDIEMGTATNGLTSNTAYAYDNYYMAAPLKEAILNGEIEESYLDDKVRRVLRLMFRTNMNPNRSYGKANNQEHLDIAQEVAEQGIVLLKNQNDFFPIKDEKNLKIALIGENATRPMTTGGGSSELKAKNEISPLKGLLAQYKNAEITYDMGYSSGASAYARVLPPTLDQDSLHIAALKRAKDADIVLFIGGLNKNHLQDCEGGDREGYALPFGQEKLIRDLAQVNPNIGVVLISGNAVETNWSSDVKGIIQGWYLGSQAGPALANIIDGTTSPSGKLPFSFPKKLEDNSAHYYGKNSYPGDGDKQYYKDDILVGYRWHDTKKIESKYPFGYGLSYTDFNMGHISMKQVGQELVVQYSIQNKGALKGAEVAQVYIGKNKSKVARAQKELKGFKKTFLEPGASKIEEIRIPIESLKFYNEEKGQWELEEGSYTLYFGNSSTNIIKKIKFSL
ncbi:MAG: glycoside hydrolase family 3 C-terminal domain-containing protein [Flavobacteriaceae bacterium]